MATSKDKSGAWQDLDGFDKLLAHRSRLGICVLLSRHEELSFRRFKELLQETDGNLGAQLRKLEDEGLITVRKEFQNRKPVSWYGLTAQGRQTLSAHLEALRRIVETDLW